LTFRHDGTSLLQTSRSYDRLNRLRGIWSLGLAAGPFTFNSAYNNVNQRVAVTNADSALWAYGYDSLGQVNSGKKYWSDGQGVAGDQFEYTFDQIGNRTQAKAGGDAAGLGLRPATYTVNALNQYTQRSMPGTNDVLGSAPANAVIYVNGSSNVYRHGEFFQTVVGQDTSDGAYWQPMARQAVWNGATNPGPSGYFFWPKRQENFTYDADGNLTQDGRWNYTWDAENRLVRVQSRDDAPMPSRWKVELKYDWQGRRLHDHERRVVHLRRVASGGGGECGGRGADPLLRLGR
jgi:YD repeat-containing protein